MGALKSASFNTSTDTPGFLDNATVTFRTAGQVQAGGKVVIKEAARAVSERDDRLLAEKMEKLRTAQEEEDSDSGSEDETMGDVDASKLGGALTM